MKIGKNYLIAKLIAFGFRYYSYEPISGRNFGCSGMWHTRQQHAHDN